MAEMLIKCKKKKQKLLSKEIHVEITKFLSKENL